MMYKKISVALLLMNVVSLSFSLGQPADASPRWKSQSWNNRGQCHAPNYHYINNGVGYRYIPGNRSPVVNNNRIDAIQNNVNAVITRGLSNGRLTQREADRLMGMQQRIDGLQTSYGVDGSLSRPERQRLNNEVSRLQSQLQRELRDRNIF